jgi:ribonuclease HI
MGSYFKINCVSGVRQGCPLSPIIFILVVDLLVDGLASINGVLVIAAYLDDNGIVFSSEHIIPYIKLIVDEYCEAIGASLGIPKCKIISNVQRFIQLPLGWEEIERVKSSKYLGMVVSLIATGAELWSRPLKKARINASIIKNLNSSVDTKIRLLNIYVFSLFSYTCRFALMHEDVVKSLNLLVRKCIGVYRKLPSSVLYNKFNITSPLPPIRNIFLWNLAHLISIKSYHITPCNNIISPLSPSLARIQAFGIVAQISPSMRPLISRIIKDDWHTKWRDSIGRKNATKVIYNGILYGMKVTLQKQLFDDLNCDPNHGNIYCIMMSECPSSMKRVYLRFLNKVIFTKSMSYNMKINNSSCCQFCGDIQTHAHILYKCKTIHEWVKEFKASSAVSLFSSPFPLLPIQIKESLRTLYAISKCIKFSEVENGKLAFAKALKDSETMFNKRKYHTQKKPRKDLPEIEIHTEYYMFSDGSRKYNPLNSGWGYVIYKKGDEKEICNGYGSCPLFSINEAEGYGAIEGLERAIDLGIVSITSFLDSKTIVDIGNSTFFGLSPSLIDISNQINELQKHLITSSFEYIPRELNSRADVIAYCACAAPSQIEEVLRNPNAKRPIAEKPIIHFDDSCLFVTICDFDFLFPVPVDFPVIPLTRDVCWIYDGPSTFRGKGTIKEIIPMRKLTWFFGTRPIFSPPSTPPMIIAEESGSEYFPSE